MKSWHYIAIFVAVVAVVGGLIWYNASTVGDIDSEIVTVKKTTTTKEAEETVVQQKDINVLTDVDFEDDVDDFVEPENLSDFDSVEGLTVDEEVTL